MAHQFTDSITDSIAHRLPDSIQHRIGDWNGNLLITDDCVLMTGDLGGYSSRAANGDLARRSCSAEESK